MASRDCALDRADAPSVWTFRLWVVTVWRRVDANRANRERSGVQIGHQDGHSRVGASALLAC